jgi:hypothetical protein
MNGIGLKKILGRYPSCGYLRQTRFVLVSPYPETDEESSSSIEEGASTAESILLTVYEEDLNRSRMLEQGTGSRKLATKNEISRASLNKLAYL